MAVFINAFGNQTYRGTAAEYDQVDYAGSLSDYTITRNNDGTVTVFHPQFGTDTLVSIEGFWFQGEAAWYSMDDAIALTGGGGGGSNTPTDGNDTLIGTNTNDVFIGSAGNDSIDGNGGAYNQVDYAGSLSDYTFTQNANGSISVAHPTLGTDTLTDIDGFWFQGEAAWYSLDQALAATGGGNSGGSNAPTNGNDTLIGSNANDVFIGSAGNDIIDGNGGAYNQVDYAGNLSDYSFIQNADGSVSVTHPTRGTDTLRDIDGFWFQGEAAWYSRDQALAASNNNGGAESHMVFSSHMDDDIIFMNNDLLDAINAGESVTTVYFRNSTTVESTETRELGIKAAYEVMTGQNDWVDETVIVNGNRVDTSYLASSPDIRLYFLQLPDGGASALESGQVQSHTALNGETYTRQELVDTLTALMDLHDPSNIMTHARSTTIFSGGDHRDHRADADITWEAMRQYDGSFDIDEYIGYGVNNLAANVTGAELDIKTEIFEAYGAFDTNALNIPVFRDWLQRTYQIGADGQPTDEDWDIRDFPEFGFF